MAREARAIGRVAAHVGAGVRSGDGLRELLRGASPDVVVIGGICGALDPSLKPGDIILSRQVVMAGRPELMADASTLDSARKAVAGTRAGSRGSRGRIAFIVSRLL